MDGAFRWLCVVHSRWLEVIVDWGRTMRMLEQRGCISMMNVDTDESNKERDVSVKMPTHIVGLKLHRIARVWV